MSFKDNNIGWMLFESTKRNLDQIALRCDGVQFTYREMFKLSLPVIDKLKKLAVEDQIVAVMIPRSSMTYCVIYGVVLSGNTYMPVSPNMSSAQIIHMLDISRASVVITDTAYVAMINMINSERETPLNTIIIDQSADVNIDTEKSLDLYNVPASKYVYTMFTSGSTGVPKCVPVGHQQLHNYLCTMTNKYKPNNTDKFSQVIELTFDLSVHDIFLCWMSGATLLVFNGQNYLQMLQYINNEKPTFWLSVPSTGLALSQLKIFRNAKYSNFKVVLFCGEPLSYYIASCWQKACPNAILENIYGPTETTIACASFRVNSIPNEVLGSMVVPIGHMLDGTIKNIVNLENHLQVRNVGECGELLIGGAQVVDGYLNNSALNKDRFVTIDKERFYKTGDIVYEDNGGVLHFKGRIDDQMQLRGVRLERLDIEIKFRELLNVTKLAVIASPITDEGIVLGVALIYTKDAELSRSEIIKRCQYDTKSPLVPSKFIELDCLPVNSSGKVDYAALKKSYQSVLKN